MENKDNLSDKMMEIMVTRNRQYVTGKTEVKDMWIKVYPEEDIKKSINDLKEEISFKILEDNNLIFEIIDKHMGEKLI